MDPRKEQLLQLVVENYIDTAEPVGSKFLSENNGLQVSGATIRNELRVLEEEGFLTHPHTSAGRIPTEAGYKFYVENIMKPKAINTKIKDTMDSLFHASEESRKVKEIGKFVAEQGNNAVIIAINQDHIYYTGISNLFSQPEFRDFAHVAHVSNIFDQCEERIGDLYNLVDENTTILIGSNNPFGSACSLVVTRTKDGGLFALMGPIRMDYNKTFGLINHIQTLF